MRGLTRVIIFIKKLVIDRMLMIKQANLMGIMEIPDLQNVDMNAMYTVHLSLPFKSNTSAKI